VAQEKVPRNAGEFRPNSAHGWIDLRITYFTVSILFCVPVSDHQLDQGFLVVGSAGHRCRVNLL
jgi:hypothetical protein